MPFFPLTTWLWIALGAVVVEAVVILWFWHDRNDWRLGAHVSNRWWEEERDGHKKTRAQLAEYEPEPEPVSDAELGDDWKVEVADKDAGDQRHVTVTYGTYRLECWTKNGEPIWAQWQVLYKRVKEPKQPPVAEVGTYVWESHPGRYSPQDGEFKIRAAAARKLGGRAAFSLPPG